MNNDHFCRNVNKGNGVGIRFKKMPTIQPIQITKKTVDTKNKNEL